MWASVRKDLPDGDLAQAGGWSSLDPLKLVYQQPDRPCNANAVPRDTATVCLQAGDRTRTGDPQLGNVPEGVISETERNENPYSTWVFPSSRDWAKVSESGCLSH